MSSPTPHLLYEDDRPWQNLHQNVRFTPAKYCDIWNFWDDNSYAKSHRWKPGLAALKMLIQDAQKAQKSIRNARALGGGWSLSYAAETKGFMANTKPLNIIEIGVQDRHCHDDFLKNLDDDGGRPEERLVFAQCGASISELNRALENVGLSLPTSGASNGQTICGAMSTSTHGAGILLTNGGGVQDYVVGVHLLGTDGQSRWIQSQTHPAINKSFCDIIEPDIELVEDDNLFDAVRVSFGSFGIIHAVLLKAVPIYLLERHVCPIPFSKIAPVLSDLNRIPDLRLTDINGRIPDEWPYHFELLINPFAFKSRTRELHEVTGRTSTYIRYMFKRSANWDSGLSGSPFLLNEQGNRTQSNDAFGIIAFLSKLLAAVPGLGSDYVAYEILKKAVIGSQLPPDNGAKHIGTILTHGGTFSATQLAGHGLSMELGFAVPDVPAALRVIVKVMQNYPFASLPALRYVRSSQALLAFTGFGDYSCAIEFPATLSDRSKNGYERVWKALEKEQIRFTFHWGQCAQKPNSPSAGLSWLRRAYFEDNRASGLPPRKDRVQLWLEARKRVLPDAASQRLFSNSMLESLGLS